MRAAVWAATATTTLAVAALMPALAATPPRAAVHEVVVPFELSGLYVTWCWNDVAEADRDAISDDREVQACLERYPVGGLSPAVKLDPREQALFRGYFVTELLPCLRARGLEPPSTWNGHVPVDISSWYLSTLMDDPEFEHAIATWFECAQLPSYLEDAVQEELDVVE